MIILRGNRLWRVSLAGLAIAAAISGAQAQTIPQEYDKLVTATSQVTGLNAGLAGDEVNLYSGQLGLNQTDISVPGNSALPVEVSRRFNAASTSGAGPGFFEDWDMALPSIHGVFSTNNGWSIDNTGSDRYNRCSQFGAPLDAIGNPDGDFSPGEFWQGTFAFLPGRGDQELLARNAETAVPTDGLTYPVVLADGSALSCLASLDGSSSPAGGEGFELVTRDGTRYRFDHMVTRSHQSLKKSSPAPQSAVVARVPNGYVLLRTEYWLYPTVVTDRFGNTVTYSWNPANPTQLQSITGSDGPSIPERSITFTYTDTIGYQVKTVSSAGRTWTYSYGTGTLTQVLQPDQSTWKFDLWDVGLRRPASTNPGCDGTSTPGNSSSGTVTHPSGAIVSFSLEAVRMPRTYVPRECGENLEYAIYPKEIDAMAIISKNIAGPGLPAGGLNWNYSYDDAEGCWDPNSASGSAYACAATTSGQRTTTVTNPDGSVDQFSYGNRFRFNEGQLLAQHSGVAGSGALRTETRTYGASDAGPYPEHIGYSYQQRGDGDFASRNHPLAQRLIQQDGVNFSWGVSAFDTTARALTVNRTGPSGSLVESTVYADKPAVWVMDQVASLTDTGTGLVKAAGTFNELGSQTQAYAFGRLLGTYTYGTDGTLASVTDANSNPTQFSSWKRGVPQLVTYADATTVSSVVDDAGWISSRSDQLGNQYGYTYDAMGRLASIAYPSDGTAEWNSTTQTFEPVAAEEYGLVTGHWRQTVATGSAQKVTYYDAFWRPVVTREYDAGNEAGTSRFQAFAYDYAGRTTFASYPAATASLETGTWTSYDALGRVTSVGQDTELDPALQFTTTSYLSGFKTQVTNPRGQVTTTSYMAYDQPTNDWPIQVAAPESVVTDIGRDVFGKPTSIVRHDAANAISVSRSYAYNAGQQLCRSVEPETGATLMGYDAAGNLTWAASGLAADLACDADGTSAQVVARKVNRAYNARNRLQTLSFPDGLGNQSWIYYDDGQPHQVTTNNADGGDAVINTYSYNNRRLLTGEGMSQPGVAEVLSIGYGYDANGNLAANTYPSGLSVAYAPNALGQPTQAGSFATGVTYFPNGALKQFAYGNGVVHTMTQNARQLPARSTDTGSGAVIDMAYGFDANANVEAVTDYVDGRQTRSMAYDGLDRLSTTQSVMFGGDSQAAFTYDALDNLKTFKVGAVANYLYAYNGNQQLETVNNSADGTAVIGLGYDTQGNLANKNGKYFDFDYGNRLRCNATAVGCTGSIIERYRYDANGRRILNDSPTLGKIFSLYGQDGVLRYQQNQRTNKKSDYVYLGGSLVARVNNVQSVGASTATVPASDTTGSYTVSWTAVADATGYTLQEKVGSGGSWTTVYTGAATTYAASGKVTNVYSYRVQACAGSTCGGWSNEATIAVTTVSAPSAAPSVSAPASSSTGSYSVSWTAVDTASSYELQENGANVYSGAGLTTALSGRSNGSYSYAARACNSGGCGPWSAAAAVVVSIPTAPAAAPSVTAPTSSATGAYSISWTAVATATAYELQENGTTIYSGADLGTSLSGRDTGSYSYAARGCNDVGCGPWSAGVTVAVSIPTPPAAAPAVSAPASSTSEAYTVSWSAVATATSYELQENSATVYAGADLSTSLSGRGSGSYSYTARGCNNAGCGPWSAAGVTTVSLIPATPTGYSANYDSISTTQWVYSASWNPSAGATSYQLQGYFGYSGPNISAQVIKKGVNPPEENPTYMVRACNDTGCSAWSPTF